MTDQAGGRRDLAAMLGPLLRSLLAIELPVLEEHGISMWGYSVLTALSGSPVRTQAALADEIGADKTRIIKTLDELQERGFITREPDPDDRRVRMLSVTEKGRRLQRAVQADIHHEEDVLLDRLPAGEQQQFLRALHTLSTSAQDEPIE
jgi:DNA-binding MarR family transcriptional regulator